MAEHGVTSVDQIVRGHPGTVATCTCGWRTSWGIQDGSAESDGHDHVMKNDPEARVRHEEGARVFREKHAAWVVENKARIAYRAGEQRPKPVEHTHGCSCHLSAPCSACENCKHPAGDFADECPDNCQDCETEHDY